MPLNWLNRIIDHEVAPPAEAWLNIANELDNETTNRLKQRLLAHEEVPPAKALENIFNHLHKEDIQTVPAYIEKIKHYSHEAPVNSWESIVAKLELKEEKVPVLKIENSNLKKFLLWTAAAASIITILIVALLPDTKQHNLATNNTLPERHQDSAKQIHQANNQNIAITDNRKNDSITFLSKTELPKQHSPNYANHYLKVSKIKDLAGDPSNNNKEKLQNNKGEAHLDIALMNSPNTYLTITGADGQTIKVSSKFSNLIEYLTDKNPDNRENIEIIIDEGPKWRKTFAEWKNKMTNNIIAPSFSNFMDIIELSKVLEKQGE